MRFEFEVDLDVITCDESATEGGGGDPTGGSGSFGHPEFQRVGGEISGDVAAAGDVSDGDPAAAGL